MDAIGYIIFLGHKIPYGALLEEWKPIIGFEDFYQISNYGRVKTTHKNNNSKTIKKPFYSKGYLKIQLCLNKKQTNYSIHRLVALHFIDNPQNKSDVNHLRGFKDDNVFTQLEWSTHQQNTKHAYENKICIRAKGNITNVKLTKQNILDIKSIYFKNGMSDKEISKIFNVSRQTINNIKNQKYWNNEINNKS